MKNSKLDVFVKNIINIIEKEDISISFTIKDDDNCYELIIDDKKYTFSRDNDYLFASPHLSIKDLSTNTIESSIKVPIGYYLNIKSLHRKQVRIGRLNYRKKAIEKEIDSINNIKEKRELYQKFKEFFNREFLL